MPFRRHGHRLLGFLLCILLSFLLLSTTWHLPQAANAAREAVCTSLVPTATTLDQLVGQCKKTLWFLAALNHGNRTGHERLCSTIDSTDGLQLLAVAVRKVLQNSPSAVPVVIYQGPPCPLTNWLKAQGAVVLFHKLSVDHKLNWDYIELHKLHEWRGNLLRSDIPLLLHRVWAQLGEAAAAQVDHEYALYTDTDVWARSDVNSCSLPKPATLSMGPEANPFSQPDNSGVLYLNLTAFSQLWEDFMAYADQHDLYSEVRNQPMMVQYFKRSTTALPPAWNWKPYWGLPQDLLWSTPEPVHLLHFHGPKPSIVLCFFDRWRALDCPDLAAVPGAFEAAVKEMEEKDTVCGGRSSVKDFVAVCGARHKYDLQLFLLAGRNGARGVYEGLRQELEESLEGMKQELCGSGGAAGAAGVSTA